MRRLRQPPRLAESLLRLAIRQVSNRTGMLPVRTPIVGASLLAGSMLLVLAPAGHALTLGDITVRSTLGQPLDAARRRERWVIRDDQQFVLGMRNCASPLK